MKSLKDKRNTENFVFDDDTSDSDDDNLEVFKTKVSSLQTKSEDLQGGDDESEDDEDVLEDSTDDGDEEESSDSDMNETDFKVVKPQLTEEKKNKLFKIQDQLASLVDDEDEDDDDEEEDDVGSIAVEARKGKETGPERDSSESDDSETDEEECSSPVKSRKRPIDSKSSVSGDKKSKLEVGDGTEVDKKAKFRAKISKMSIEEIQRLKNQIGLKLFNQKMSGTAEENKKADFKRENKNRPREMSSKRQVGRFREVISVSSEVKAPKRDPRFDPICGEYNERLFKDNYGFVNEYKVSDLKFLKKQLQEEEDSERKEQIKYLIQRTENQLRQLDQDKEKEMEKKAEIEERKTQLKAGIKPVYISKSKQKEKDLVKKYEKLKESGGLDNYIKKKTKKNVAKDRKRFEKL